MGGGGFSMEAEASVLDDYVLSLSPAREPRICLLPTAGGDSEEQIRRFRIAFGDRLCEPSVVSLFRLELEPLTLREHLLAQDVIYVGGGSMINLLALWRAHGIDSILREAWESGVILCGLSAGSLCWFDEAVSGFHGEPKRLRGLGLLPFSNCVHYERGAQRGEAYHRFLREGMRGGYAAEDGAALHFTGAELSRVVASRPQARGYRLDIAGSRVVEMQIATTYLGDRDAVPAAPLPEALSTAPAA